MFEIMAATIAKTETNLNEKKRKKNSVPTMSNKKSNVKNSGSISLVSLDKNLKHCCLLKRLNANDVLKYVTTRINTSQKDNSSFENE